MRPVMIVVGIVIVIVALVTVIPLLLETNPPVIAEPKWDSPQTRELAVRSCFDCHSNETKYPWFARLPVSSLLVVSDTLQGRAHLNFSEWNTASGSREGRNAREIARQIQSGAMPPGNYLLLHPEAALTDAEKQQLIDGLTKSLNQ